jgi:4-carboxymuconolactone decarboxylase
MTLLNPETRTARGIEQQSKLLAQDTSEPTTLYESSWRDFIFAEVWDRPGLDLRSRYLITISSAASNDTPAEMLDGYVRGALSQKLVSLSELREVSLHLAIYGGWSRGALIDASITRVSESLGLPAADYEPIRAEEWSPQQRLQKGADEFERVMTFGGPPPVSAYFEGGILNFVFGEAWCRKGLDQRARRWVTLVGVADSSADTPIRTHIYGAMASGNASYEEMNEFVLQYAIHSGWPKASVAQGAVMEMAKKIQSGLFWDGTVLEKNDESSK